MPSSAGRTRCRATADFDRDLWAVLVDQGWPAIEQPEADGGLGLGMVEVCILSEQLGRHAAPVPFFGTTVALHVLRDAATDERLPPETRAVAAPGWPR